jgi:hypothetical protein
MGTKSGAAARLQPLELPLPNLSQTARDQLAETLTMLDGMAEKNLPIAHLLAMIGEAVKDLAGEEPVSDLTVRYIDHEVALAQMRCEYSTSGRPWAYVAYHACLIVLWVGLAIPHRQWIIRIFGGGPLGTAAVVSVISGAIGASLFALNGLYRGRIRLDLDPRFAMWYLLKPLVGAIMGGFVGLLASIVVHGVGGVGLSPLTIITAGLGGMHEAWAMNILQNYTNKTFGQVRRPGSTSSTSG